MNVDKNINKEYQKVIDICKAVKAHATNAVLLENGLVVLEPSIDEVRNYMILHDENSYPRFSHLYINLSEISKINTKFKKTLSSLTWLVEDGIAYLEIENVDMAPYRVCILRDQPVVEDLLNRVYSKIPGWNEIRQATLMDEPDEMYTFCPGVAADLASKKMCKVVANGNMLMFSRPFLGDTKNTEIIGYRIIHEDIEPNGKITVKFKQKEKLGNIYTYASFLKIPWED